MSKKNEIPKDNNIIRIPIEEAMPDNYLPYAVEVARDRALPDVRDGLKPVHRRILYGAYKMKAFPDKPYYKSARIVGDILGKYHPHGDTSVYDAMVIMAQDFSTRKPLIDGHGNWGSIDGDSAAAMRYTEARLTPIAMEMLRDIDKDIVNMVNNYSDSELEPEVLPGRYPNLLVNGAFGIAVGLATNIPPHNLKEVIDAALAYMGNNDLTTIELMKHIKGPDLPTGGILIGKNALLSAYETGEGKVTLRAKANIEMIENGKQGIVITEFPYRRNKAKLLQTISDMTADKRHAKALENITDIRDESDRNGIRAVIEFKKSATKEDIDKTLKYLYKKTDLQINLSFNMVALCNGKPETMGLKTIIKHYIQHQKDVITKRTKKELETAEKRFHIVQGFIKAIDIMDEIIAMIRASKSKKNAAENLMLKFSFTQIQADAILELMLYRLTGLEIKIFEKEYKELEKIISRLKKILADEKELLKVIRKELLEIREKYGDERRTEIIEDDSEAKIDFEELIIVEDVVITMSNEGYLKRVPLKSYNRSNTNIEDIEYREGDYNKYLFNSNTRDVIVVFTNKGNMYKLKCIDIPEMKWKEKGQRIDELVKQLNLADENIIAAYSIDNFINQKDFMFFTTKGYVKKSGLDKYDTNYSKLQAVKLRNGEEVCHVEFIEREREEKFIRINTESGLEFVLEEPVIESSDRNIMPLSLTYIGENDKITKVSMVEEYENKVFVVKVDNKGVMKALNSSSDSKSLTCHTDSSETILLFTEKGLTLSIPSYKIQNIGREGIEIEKIVDQFVASQDKIINMLSIANFNEKEYIYFFSKNGLVKKTILSDFKMDSAACIGYKLKNNKDSVVKVIAGKDEENNVIIFTRRAMAINFDSNSINPMGKVASGVTGISLKEADEVIDAYIIEKKSNREFNLISNKNESKIIAVKEIKEQNRAGRGNNIMLVVMDEFIEKVELTI